ncbi:hypothetical protein [Polaribacter uvawellassae]|uniref:hypothetical protein n=1 Tax=Polaribacter uvawellassae TaxID=3133495 RepID=UPI00321A2FA9
MKKVRIKKGFALSALFLGPLIFYIFLSLGIYHHANLPILTKNVENIKGEVSFKDHFSVVSFLGTDIEKSKGGLFNLNEVIYKRYRKSMFFQSVLIAPKGTETQVEALKTKLSTYTDIKSWKFVFMDADDIKTVFNSFDSPYTINQDLSSEYVFIVDRELRLRGRKDDEDTENGRLYGYDMNSVNDLKNKMKNDIEIIYYQLKKSLEKEKRFKRKI